VTDAFRGKQELCADFALLGRQPVEPYIGRATLKLPQSLQFVSVSISWPDHDPSSDASLSSLVCLAAQSLPLVRAA
jgi:hypothetical protein